MGSKLLGVGALLAVVGVLAMAEGTRVTDTLARPLVRRATPVQANHSSMMHNHLSRKVFERACAASKDTIEEIITCFTSNEFLIKSINPDSAAACYKDAFGIDFEPKDISKHKEMVCNNRDKFETMTACIYRKTAEILDPKQLEKVTEAMVDVGLCVINALDG